MLVLDAAVLLELGPVKLDDIKDVLSLLKNLILLQVLQARF